ncbi:hypothetical protein NG812_09240 [Lactococcus garvieae]|jgi:hypothetical protein|uniref:hypothetical protein n=1 Tax=Lactococcus garvieae TaxID=1363 RepID=UPI0022E15C45|nr:hypothetical protein [Lactococcus garvieae]
MMTKNIIKRLSFLALILSVLFILAACSKKDKESQSNKNLTPIEQFEVASQAGRPDLKELESVFGKGASWEMGGAPVGGEVKNEYEFMLKLPKVEPMEQASFDELKAKAIPFTNKLLEEMKKVGIKNPVVKLKIVDKNASEFEGCENLKTEYRLTP